MKFQNVMTNEIVDVTDLDDIEWYKAAGPPWHRVASLVQPTPYPPSQVAAKAKAKAAAKAAEAAAKADEPKA